MIMAGVPIHPAFKDRKPNSKRGYYLLMIALYEEPFFQNAGGKMTIMKLLTKYWSMGIKDRESTMKYMVNNTDYYELENSIKKFEEDYPEWVI